MSRDPLSPELLEAWLSAEDEPARQAVLEAHAPGLGAPGVRALLELAAGGPAYGGDRRREAALQRALLDLARGVAEQVGAWPEAARACHQLALAQAGGARRAWLERAARHAITADAWEVLARVEADLAVDALAARQPREALAARARALAACRRDARDAALNAVGDETADALATEAVRLGDPRAAWGGLQDWLAHVRKGGDMVLVARACERLGVLAGQLGRALDAERWLGEAAALYGEQMEEASLARVLLRRMAIAVESGDIDAVARRAADVLALRERTADPAVRELIDEAGDGF